MAVDHEVGTNEISVDWLFSKFDRQHEAVVDGKIERLPLHDRLTPDNFERLIARLADPADGVSVRAFRYGKSGSTQCGVDVIVIDAIAQACDYYEGKRWARISKGDITAWVDRFLSGSHAADARKFVICTTFDVFEVTELAMEWKNCAKLLGERKIHGDLWDGEQIHRLLRHRYSIVCELFGDDVAKRYCVQDMSTPSEPPSRQFAAKRVGKFGRSLSLENESVRCEVLLPGDDVLSMGAILSFARRDLSGISITVSGKELVRWMHWRAHAQADAARPFAPEMVGDSSRAVLMAQSARLTLTWDEVEHLDWILQEAWDSFYEHATKQLLHYRCGRFRRLHGNTGPFVLASVDRSLWRAMLEFAQSHDFADGSSPWHIFDSAPGCLKPYTREASERFDSGYHAILYAYSEGSIWLPWENRVAIGWEIPTAFGRPVDMSARTNWDAEFVHDWLLEEFIPEVIRWKNAVRQEPLRQLRLWYRRAAPPIQKGKVAVSSVASSSAIGKNPRTVPEDFNDLVSCTEALQSHFYGRRSCIAIEPTLAKAVLEAIDRVLTFTNLPRQDYLRGCLSMPSEEDLVTGVRSRARSDSQATSQAAIDFYLRGLLEVFREVGEVPLGEWRKIAALLQPVLDRYHEDVVCDLFMAD